MSKLSQRERVLLLLFFGILFLYVVYQYWYDPFLKQNQYLIAKRDSLQEQWQDIQWNLGAESKLKQDVEKLKTETTSLQNQIVSGNNMAAFFQAMITIADQSNVKLGQIETTGTAVPIGTATHPQTTMSSSTSSTNQTIVGTNNQFTVSGDASSVANFFDRIQHIPYTIAIQQGVMQVKGDQVNISFLVLVP